MSIGELLSLLAYFFVLDHAQGKRGWTGQSLSKMRPAHQRGSSEIPSEVEWLCRRQGRKRWQLVEHSLQRSSRRGRTAGPVPEGNAPLR